MNFRIVRGHAMYIMGEWYYRFKLWHLQRLSGLTCFTIFFLLTNFFYILTVTLMSHFFFPLMYYLQFRFKTCHGNE